MKWIIAIGLTCASVTAAADDGQLWLEAGIRRELSKRTTLTFDQHLRFDQDISRVMSVMPEPGLDYRFKKWLQAGLAYRFEYERDDNGDFVNHHRIVVYARLRHEVGPIRLGLRLMFQESIRPEKNKELKHVSRNRFDISYRAVQPIVPNASIELFHRLGDGSTARYEKARITFGVGFEKKRWDGDLFYRIEVPDDAMEPTLHIIGVGFHADL